MKRFRFGLAALVMCLYGAVALGQAPVIAAPVPQAVLKAKRIFVANAGADAGLFPHPFSGEPERGYNQLYAAVKALDTYELVGSPGDADLVLELRLHAPSGPANADKTKGASDPLPMFRLVIYDTKTHYVLWALTEQIDRANLQKSHDHNFDEAITQLVGDFKKLGSKTP